MSEIRQIQVDGVNYDLVITEDEVAATRAEQAAQQAATSASQAAANSAQASEYSITAGEYAQDAEDAADRAEAIVGGQFVSYGQSQGLTEAEKTTARTNIGVTKHTNPNLLDNWYFVGDGTPKTFPINQRGKNYYAVNDYTIDRWKSVTPWENSCTVKVATQPGGLVLAGDINTDNPNTYVQFQQIVENPPYGKEVTLSLLVDTLGADDDGNYPQIWCGASAYKNITAVGLSSLTFTWPNDQNENYIRIVLYDGATQASSIRIQAIKLELGAVSTLAQDAPPSYGEELTKCIYSKADPNDRYANNGFGRSNDNLLDNWYFVGGGSQSGNGVFPINQRGQTSYGASTRAFDRWITESGSSVTLSSNGATFSGSTVSLYDGATAANLVGKTVTISAQLGDGTIISGTGVVNPLSQDTTIQAWLPTGGYVGFFIFANAQSYQFCRIYSGSATLIRAVKLEVGTVSTLANDVPPDFGAELRKCQRYLFIRDYAQNDVIMNGITNNLTMFLPVSMRSGGSPTMTFTVTPYVIGNGVISTPTSVNLVSVNGNQVQIYAPTTESHSEQAIVLYAGSATRMTIANEL